LPCIGCRVVYIVNMYCLFVSLAGLVDCNGVEVWGVRGHSLSSLRDPLINKKACSRFGVVQVCQIEMLSAWVMRCVKVVLSPGFLNRNHVEIFNPFVSE
jgi:hypothetical protein